MDFAYSPRVEEMRRRLGDFMDNYVLPRVPDYEHAVRAGTWPPVFFDDLKTMARSEGLWNLFLTGRSAEAVRKWEAASGKAESSLPDPPLTNLQYAPLAEITGWSPALAPEALNCAAPDTGNMEVLAEFGFGADEIKELRAHKVV